MRKTIRKILSLLCALPLLLYAFSIQAQENPSGTITLQIPESLTEQEISLDLYQIADVSFDENGSLQLSQSDSFSENFSIREDLLGSESFLDYASDYIDQMQIEPDQNSGVIVSKESVTFENLQPGVYLIRAADHSGSETVQISNMLVSLPVFENGIYSYSASAQIKYNLLETEQPKEETKNSEEETKNKQEETSTPEAPKLQQTSTTNTTSTSKTTATPAKTTIPKTGTMLYATPILAASGLFLVFFGILLLNCARRQA